jgi:hypothetical protein
MTDHRTGPWQAPLPCPAPATNTRRDPKQALPLRDRLGLSAVNAYLNAVDTHGVIVDETDGCSATPAFTAVTSSDKGGFVTPTQKVEVVERGIGCGSS